MVVALRLGGLVLWGSAVLSLINPPWMAWSQVELPTGLRWTGVALGVISVGLIYWLFSSIGSGITPTVATRKEHVLVTHGPYHWVRHPLYTVATTAFHLAGLDDHQLVDPRFDNRRLCAAGHPPAQRGSPPDRKIWR